MSDRPCTCHPSEAPKLCQKMYALGECQAADEIARLRAVLDLYRQAVRIDATMAGPKFMGSNASALKRAWDADLAALGGGDE